MNKWYTYHLIDPRSKSVFYVGKGHGRRMYVHRTRALKWESRDRQITRNTNRKLFNKILSIVNDGFDVEYKIVEYFEFEKQALDFEEFEIARIGLDKLTNLTKGGEGEQKSPEILEKMSASMRAFWKSPEGQIRRKESSEMRMGKNNPMYGTVEDEEHKKLRMANCLAKPRWNKGLKGDPRAKGLPKGEIPSNSKKCFAISCLTNEKIVAPSMKHLAQMTNIPHVTVVRMLTIPQYRSRNWDSLWRLGFE